MQRVRRSAFSLLLVTILVASACSGDNVSAPSQAADIPALQMIDRTVGTGAAATAGSSVTVRYTGWLYSPTASGNKGTQFDHNESYPFTLGVGRVIPGWDQGVAGMRVGGSRTLLIPSSLGYGPSGFGPIPPNSALVFDIDLLGVQ